MTPVQPAVAIAIFSVIICAILLKWEIPFQIGDIWWQVMAGFPCHLYSSYESHSPFPSSPSIPSFEPVKLLPWKCDRLQGNGHQCFSSLLECTENTQYSIGFWDLGANFSCRREGAPTECSEISLAGNFCRNVVKEITHATSSVVFHLSDFLVGTAVLQQFTHSSEPVSCYSQGDLLEFNQNVQNIPRIIFNQNSTFRTTLNSENCESLQRLLDVSKWENAFICNCGKCDISLISSQSHLNDSCVIAKNTELVVPIQDGKVIGAVIKFTWVDVNPRFPIVSTFKTTFLPYNYTSVTSRFWSTRGRFHCPSEVSCWLELAYPFFDWNSLDKLKMIIVLALSAIFTVIVFNKRT